MCGSMGVWEGIEDDVCRMANVKKKIFAIQKPTHTPTLPYIHTK